MKAIKGAVVLSGGRGIDVWKHFTWSQGSEALLLSSGGMLLNILQGTGKVSTAKQCSGKTFKNAKVEKPRYRGINLLRTDFLKKFHVLNNFPV